MHSISIALATYNGERYILEQLESLAAQSLLPAELVICDDGSQDRTLELIQTFANAAPFPVHVHRNEERLGFRANFMKVAGLCKGDLIAFCDQDDVWATRKLELVSARFDNDEVILAYHNSWVVGGDLTPLRLVFTRQAAKKLNRELEPAWFNARGHSMVVRRGLAVTSDLWKLSIDPNEPKSVLPYDIWIYFLSSCLGTVVYIDIPLVYYRQHGENAYGFIEHPIDIRSFRPSLVRASLVASAKWYRDFQRAAENRAELLTRLRDQVETTASIRISQAISRYRRLSERLALRAELYNSGRFKDRFRIICRIIKTGGYGNIYGWTFGKAALAKDLLLVLPFGSGSIVQPQAAATAIRSNE